MYHWCTFHNCYYTLYKMTDWRMFRWDTANTCYLSGNQLDKRGKMFETDKLDRAIDISNTWEWWFSCRIQMGTTWCNCHCWSMSGCYLFWRRRDRLWGQYTLDKGSDKLNMFHCLGIILLGIVLDNYCLSLGMWVDKLHIKSGWYRWDRVIRTIGILRYSRTS